MAASARTDFDAAGLTIGGAALAYYAGAMHYWRVAPTMWRAQLRSIAMLGMRIVDICVPWAVHDRGAGRGDFSGSRDLARFIATAADVGLAVVIRPGPTVDAELAYYGLPERIVSDAQIQARTSHGTPVWLPMPPRAWPVPSYASQRFRSEVQQWFTVVGEIVAPLLAPQGPIVAIGIDHHSNMFARRVAFDHDYHPDAIAWWREATGDEGEPPRAWEESTNAANHARAIAWVRAHDSNLARAVGEFSTMLDDVGCAGIARFHASPATTPWLVDLPRIAVAARANASIDLPFAPADLDAVQRAARLVVGSNPTAPIIFGHALSVPAWLPAIALDGRGLAGGNPRDTLLTALAAGIKGFGIDAAIARDGVVGSAIAHDGTITTDGAWITALIAALDEIDWPQLHTVTSTASIALIASRADARFAQASNLLDPMTPVLSELLGLGPAGAAELGSDDDARAHRRWFTAIEHGLTRAGVHVEIVDEGVSEEQLARHAMVIVPTIHRVDRSLWQRLRTLAEHKRLVVIAGPGAPTLDELGLPLGDDAPPPRRLGRLRAESLDARGHDTGLNGDLADLAAAHATTAPAFVLAGPPR